MIRPKKIIHRNGWGRDGLGPQTRTAWSLARLIYGSVNQLTHLPFRYGAVFDLCLPGDCMNIFEYR